MIFTLNALNKQPLWNAPNEGEPTATPNSDDTPAPDATPKDVEPPADPLADDTPKAPEAPEDPLADKEDGKEDDDASAEFGLDAVEAGALKELFPGEEGQEEPAWNDDALDKLVTLINEGKSRAEIAENVIKLYDEVTTTAATEISTQFNETVQSWREESQNHFGKDYDAAIKDVRELINTYAPDAKATFDFLRQTGASSSMHVLSLLRAVAKAVPGEAVPADGDPAPTGKSQAERLFGGT